MTLPDRSDGALTVADLMAKLGEYPPDQLVLVDGYESGMQDPKLREVEIVYNPDHESWWAGDYDEPYSTDEGPRVKALVVGR